MKTPLPRPILGHRLNKLLSINFPQEGGVSVGFPAGDQQPPIWVGSSAGGFVIQVGSDASVVLVGDGPTSLTQNDVSAPPLSLNGPGAVVTFPSGGTIHMPNVQAINGARRPRTIHLHGAGVSMDPLPRSARLPLAVNRR